MTTTVQQRNGFGSRLFSWGKEFGPVWPLFLRSRKGATRTVRAAAAQAACDPRGRKPHLWSCGPQIVVHRKLPENELHACKEWPQVAQTSDSQVRTCGVFHKKKRTCGVSGPGATQRPWHGVTVADIWVQITSSLAPSSHERFSLSKQDRSNRIHFPSKRTLVLSL